MPTIVNEELHSVAIHEAGHAVAHIRLNIDQECATIVRGVGTLGGVTAEADPWTKGEAQAQVIAYCSGYAACVAAQYAEDRANEGCWDDFERAQTLIEFWDLDALADCKAKSVELMCIAENIRAVNLIGQYLMQHGTVDADCMAVLVDVADGGTTQAEFDEYIRFRAKCPADWQKK